MNAKQTLYSLSEVSDMLSVSKETLIRWNHNGKLVPVPASTPSTDAFYKKQDLEQFKQLAFLFDRKTTAKTVKPLKTYTSIELFAGAGGLALGLEKAGLHCLLLNELDKNACQTLRKNRPNWNVVEGDIAQVDFTPYQGKVDVLTGGFPCQAFSYAGKKLGFEDARGTLFYQFARAIKETQPLIAVGENVRGLVSHEQGKTLEGMLSVLDELGYNVLTPQVLKAIFYNVPQKRERLFIVAVRKDVALEFAYPEPEKRILMLKDTLKAGVLYESDVPVSEGQLYPKAKAEVMRLVPPGGYWRNLPLEIQKAYMKQSFYLGGGKTGMARRMSWDEPSLTLTCAPAQKQTERCHPDETRPFTVREYARIQTFPDDWAFSGSVGAQYKQIGNAVPVNLAYALGRELVRSLNQVHAKKPALI
jgi:DNA (cytosine-5)-methyltransferase 1